MGWAGIGLTNDIPTAEIEQGCIGNLFGDRIYRKFYYLY